MTKLELVIKACEQIYKLLPTDMDVNTELDFALGEPCVFYEFGDSHISVYADCIYYCQNQNFYSASRLNLEKMLELLRERLTQ